MRVLMLNYEYPPLGGGAGNATGYFVREFMRMPEVTLDLVTSSVGRYRVERPADNVALHFLDIGKTGDLHYQSYRDLVTYSWKARGYCRRLMREHSYDLCHAFFGIPCGCIAMRLGLPYIVSLRGSDVPFYSERFKHLDRFVFKRLSRRVWGRAGRVIANSEGLRDLARESIPEVPVDVICNGVDTEMFCPSRRDAPGLRVICVSRLIARKGIAYLIRALTHLKDLDVTVTLVGTGNERELLETVAREAGVTERVRFAGFVAHDDIGDMYRQHDVFVLPSLNEGMSNTALEAMACGLPLVMTDTGGAAELLEDGGNGFLVRQRSEEDIAQRLREYALDKALARRHGERARARAEEMSWHAVVEAYVEAYRSVIP